MIDLAMETEECKLPLDDWLVGAESGFRSILQNHQYSLISPRSLPDWSTIN